MRHQFRFRARVEPWRAPPPPAFPPAAEAGPFHELLNSLRGREITVTFGARESRGKLVLTDPITLVGPGGEVTVVAPAMVTSVQF